MHPANMAEFFLWCGVINTGLMVFWTLVFVLAPGWVHRTQNAFFPISREQLSVVLYCYIGFFKALIIVFNWVPYFALRIMA